MVSSCGSKSTESSELDSDTIAIDDTDIETSTPSSDNDELIDAFLEQTEEIFPQNIGDMMVITKATLDGDYIVCDVVVNEDYISISDLKQNKDEAKNNVKKNLDEDLIEFLKKVNKGIAYKYIGVDSEKTCTVRLTPYDIRNM